MLWRSFHDAWWRLTTTPPQSLTAHLLGGALQGGALLYGTAVGVRNRAYDRGWLRQERLACGVISVGNLSVGGTGKTACVAYLADRLRRFDKRVCILSRGYGGRAARPYRLVHEQGRFLVNGEPVSAEDGLPDEPRLLASHLSGVPVFIGAKREQTGRLACEACHADVVILDDGFQYRRLSRDCDIVLVNARMPLGGWPLFPRGPLREPLTELSRADAILITKADQSLEMVAALRERLRALNPAALIATAVHEPAALWDWVTEEPVALEHLAERRVSLLSSIGDPEGFEQTVKRMGASVVSHTAYPDHYRYHPSEWEGVCREAAASRAEALVTTEKDLVRLRQFRQVDSGTPIPVWALTIRMRVVSGEAALDDRLARVCAG